MSREVPEGWQHAPLGDVFDVNWGDTSITKSSYSSEGYTAFSASGPDGLLPSFQYQENGVVVSAIGARSGRCFYATGKWTAIKNTLILRNNSKIDFSLEFAFHLLNDPAKWPVEGGAQPFIGLKKARASIFCWPPVAEQRCIAEILSSVHDAIQATQAVIEQTRKVKQGILQRLLSKGIGHNHFKLSDAGQVPQSWRVVRIAEVATAKGGKRMPKGHPFASGPTPHPYIRVSDFKNGTISSRNLMYVFPETQKEIKNYTISSSDVYISIAGTIGLSGTIPSEFNGAQLTENAAKLVVMNPQELDYRFLAHLMQSEIIQRQILSAKGIGGGVPKLALFRIEQMFMPLPPIEEQIAIVKFARVIDSEVKAQENILSRVLSIKSALMSDLLTGRRRVSTDLALAAE